jgi:hypothetical protein
MRCPLQKGVSRTMTPFGFELPGSVADALGSDFVALRGGLSAAAAFLESGLAAFGSVGGGTVGRDAFSPSDAGTAVGFGGAMTGAAVGSTTGEGAGGAAGVVATGVTALDVDFAPGPPSLAKAKAATPSRARPPKTNGSLPRLRRRGG